MSERISGMTAISSASLTDLHEVSKVDGGSPTGYTTYKESNDQIKTLYNSYFLQLAGGTMTGDITFATTKGIKTGTTATNTLLFSAYDVDNTTYRTFGTLTAGNTPSCAFTQPSGGTLTWDGGAIGGTTAAAGTFTTFTATGNTSLQGVTAADRKITIIGHQDEPQFVIVANATQNNDLVQVSNTAETEQYFKVTGAGNCVFSRVMTGKTGDYIRIGDSVDSTKQVLFDTSGSTAAAHTALVFNATVTRAITFPDATGTVVLAPVSVANGGTVGKNAVLHCMGEMFSYLTTGATLVQAESTTNKSNYRAFSFAASGNNYAGFRIPLPTSWNAGTLTYRIFWTSATTTGNVVWNVDAIVRDNTDAFDIAFGTAVSITSAAPGSANNMVETSESSALTPGGTASGPCELEVRINRNGGAGSDTMAGTAIITNFLLYYTTNTATP